MSTSWLIVSFIDLTDRLTELIPAGKQSKYCFVVLEVSELLAKMYLDN